MFGYKTTILGTFLSASLATAAFAQDTNTTTVPADGTAAPTATTAPAEGATAPAEATAAPADCGAQFTTLDADGSGFLSEAEAPRVYARARVDELAMQDTGVSKDEFLAQCGNDRWTQNVPEEGAPLEGANSFTEEQARDRAVSWNVTEVSALTLDEKGVWRGTGKMDGADVSVAVDYKGNVVATPKS